jgi:hypothetical protein
LGQVDAFEASSKLAWQAEPARLAEVRRAGGNERNLVFFPLASLQSTSSLKKIKKTSTLFRLFLIPHLSDLSVTPARAEDKEYWLQLIEF